MKAPIPSSRLWPTLLLTGLVTFSSVAQASSMKTCANVKCEPPPPPSAENLVPMATHQGNTTPTSLKKSVTRFSGGAASLRQQVIEQNKTSKAQ